MKENEFIYFIDTKNIFVLVGQIAGTTAGPAGISLLFINFAGLTNCCSGNIYFACWNIQYDNSIMLWVLIAFIL